jgi:alkylation response protein AidB-like acyl-CoA dehydrogenase
MNLRDTADEARFRAELRTWIAAHLTEQLRGLRGARDRVSDAGRDWSRAMSAAGYAGLTWPREYGGGGRPRSFQAILYQELAHAEAPGHMGSIGLSMAGPTIIAFGTEDQKRRHLARILSAEEVWCQGFSESEAGSDLAGVRTRAELTRDGTAFRVNGHKVWSSYAHLADWCILLTRSERGSERHRGLTYLLMDMRSDGVEVRPLRQITGGAQFNELYLEDVRIPCEQVVGEVGDGWRVAMATLMHERATLGFSLAATLEVTLRRLVTLVRAQAVDDPVIRDELAGAWIDVQALQLTNQRALSALERDGVPGPEGSVAKLQWSEINQRVTHLALEVLGPDGLVTDGEGEGSWQYLQLRSRGGSIEAGTSEILRNIIAERVLALPRGR